MITKVHHSVLITVLVMDLTAIAINEFPHLKVGDWPVIAVLMMQ